MHEPLEIINCRTLLNSPIDSVLLIDRYGTVLDANETVARRFGRRVPDLVGVNIYEMLPPELATSRKAFIEKVLESGEPCRFEDERDGVWYDHILSPVSDDQGNVMKILIWARDITERKRMEDISRLGNRVLEASPEHISIVGRDYIYRYVNKTYVEVHGLLQDQIVGKHVAELLGKDVFDGLVKPLLDRCLAGEEIKYESLFNFKNAGRRLMLVRYLPLKNRVGEIDGVVVFSRDITDIKSSEEKLLASEQKFRSLVEVTTDWIWEVDEKGTYTYASPKIKDILGYEPEEILGQTPFDLMLQDEAARIKNIFMNKLIDKEPFYGLENINRHKDGRLIVLETNGIPVFDEKGRFKGHRGIDRDITERKRFEKLLLDNEDRLKKAQAIARLGSWELDVVNNNLTWSDEVYRIFGLQPGEFAVSYEAFLEAVHPDDRTVVDEAYSRSLRDARETYEIEHRIVRKSTGEIRYVHEKCAHIRDASGMIIKSVGMVQDITERKRTEEALRSALEESQQREQEVLALQKSSNAVLRYRLFKESARFIFDSCKNLIGATAGYVALLSEDKRENRVLILDPGGLSCTVDPSLPMPIRGLRERAYSTGSPVYHNNFAASEWKSLMPDGHANLDNVLFSPLVIDGQVLGLLGLANKPGGFTDNDAHMASAFGEITAIALLNSRTMNALQNSEEHFRSVVETATDAIITINQTGNIVFWNRAAEIIFGHPAGEVLGRPLDLIIPKRFREDHKKAVLRTCSGVTSKLVGKTSETVGLSKNGREFPIELSIASWKTAEGAFFTGIVRDITDRKQFEASLKNERDKIQKYLDIAEVIMVVIGANESVVLINRKGCEVLGCEQDEVIGLNWFDNFVPSGIRDELRSVFSNIISGRLDAVRYYENTVLTRSGEERTIAWNNTVLKDDNGGINCTLSSGTDITQRKRMEEELQKAKDDLELKVQQRTEELNSAVGRLQEEVNERREAEKTVIFYQQQLRALLSKLSLAEEQERRRISEHIHDNISQNLAISKMNIETLQEEFLPAAGKLKETQELIEQTIKFIRSLTFELSPPILHELGLNAAVEWLAEKVQERYGIIVECDTDSKFKVLKGETGILLFRTIRELLNNIIKHSKAESARVSIQGYGDYMEIRVEDDGVGFDVSEISDYLIKGESFGIASIRERISYMNGNFEISSSPGEGTKVRIIVPLHK